MLPVRPSGTTSLLPTLDIIDTFFDHSLFIIIGAVRFNASQYSCVLSQVRNSSDACGEYRPWHIVLNVWSTRNDATVFFSAADRRSGRIHVCVEAFSLAGRFSLISMPFIIHVCLFSCFLLFTRCDYCLKMRLSVISGSQLSWCHRFKGATASHASARSLFYVCTK